MKWVILVIVLVLLFGMFAAVAIGSGGQFRIKRTKHDDETPGGPVTR